MGQAASIALLEYEINSAREKGLGQEYSKLADEASEVLREAVERGDEVPDDVLEALHGDGAQVGLADYEAALADIKQQHARLEREADQSSTSRESEGMAVELIERQRNLSRPGRIKVALAATAMAALPFTMIPWASDDIKGEVVTAAVGLSAATSSAAVAGYSSRRLGARLAHRAAKRQVGTQ